MYRQCACVPIIIMNDYENINMEKICLFQSCLNSPEWLSNSDMIEVRAGVHGAEGSMQRRHQLPVDSGKWGTHTHPNLHPLHTHARTRAHTERRCIHPPHSSLNDDSDYT